MTKRTTIDPVAKAEQLRKEARQGSRFYRRMLLDLAGIYETIAERQQVKESTHDKS